MESLKKRFDGLVTSLTKKQDGSADKDSKIVYIFAPPGTGKVCCCVLSYIHIRSCSAIIMRAVMNMAADFVLYLSHYTLSN